MDLHEQLISRGYSKHVAGHYTTFKHTDILYQKRISDSKGKKYFINIWYYPANRYGYTDLPESIQAEVQFNGDGVTDEYVDVTLFTKDIDKIEEVFENMWVKLGLGYCELWEAC